MKIGAPLFHLAWHIDSNPRMLLQDCQKLGVVAETVLLEAPKFS